MKKILSLTLVLVLLLTTFVPVLAESKYEEQGEILKDLKLLTGDEEGNLMLDKNFKRQDMVVMISRLYGKESTAKSYSQGKNVFKDLTSKERWYIPYITWAYDNDLVKGMEKDEFGFDRFLKVQEFQTVLLRVLRYGKDAENWDKIPEIAKTLGLMEGLDLNPNSNIKRGEMAAMILNALNLEVNGQASHITLADTLGIKVPELFKVKDETSINNNTIVFKGSVEGAKSLKVHLRPTSSGITGGAKIEDVPLNSNGQFSYEIADLQTGNYEYRFESGSKHTNFKRISIDKVAFEFIEASAENLKEISLKFTQPIDTSSASFISNYNTTAGSIKDIRFVDNNKTIILTLNGTMRQQGNYKVSTSNIKSLDGQVRNIKDAEFTALDQKIPTVVDVVQLGTKGIKVIFSEPIKAVASSNFKIDGKNFNGRVALDNNVITLSYLSSFYSLPKGNHILTVTGIVDFADYKAVDENINFLITEDKTAPYITGATATLEEVIVEFDEDIDPVSASKNNFYWMSGSLKRYADNVVFKDNKAYVSFKNNRLSYNDVKIYVENVVDYSGNRMRADSITVKPVIDQSQPEVVSYKVADDGRSITVFYSKNVEGKNRTNYSITSQDNKNVYIRNIEGSGREFTIYLSTVLPIGRNLLTIQGVQDTTPLKNPVKPFSVEIDMADVEKPKILSHTGYGNMIMINFSKEMDASTVMNLQNYLLTFAGREIYLPEETMINMDNGGKSITIHLPEYIDNTKVMVGTARNVSAINLFALKDIVGNSTDPIWAKLNFDSSSSGNAKAVDYYNDIPGKQAVLEDENVVRIKFNIPIYQASKDDFTVAGRTIQDAYVDGTNIVTLYLDNNDYTSIPSGTLNIVTNNNMRTSLDTKVEPGVVNVLDKVAPRLKYDINYLNVNGSIIELPFTEILEEAGEGLYVRDLEIIREADGHILRNNEYKTSLGRDKSIINITITNRPVSSTYSVRVVGETSSSPSYIMDLQGNRALESGYSYSTIREIVK